MILLLWIISFTFPGSIYSGADLNYPTTHIIGFTYQPANRLPTRLAVELAYEKWVQPLFVYKLGIEHHVTEQQALRYGFCLLPDYNEKSIWTTVFCIGYGMKRDRFMVDIAYSYAKRDYSSYSLNLALPENLYFSESSNNIILSVGYYF